MLHHMLRIKKCSFFKCRQKNADILKNGSFRVTHNSCLQPVKYKVQVENKQDILLEKHLESIKSHCLLLMYLRCSFFM